MDPKATKAVKEILVNKAFQVLMETKARREKMGLQEKRESEVKLAPREPWGFLEQEDQWDRKGSQENQACWALPVRQASMGGMESREPKVTEVFRDRRESQEKKVILGSLGTLGGKE